MSQGGTGEPSTKKLHPFFTKSDIASAPEDASTTQLTTTPSVTAGSESSAAETATDEPQRKRRKTNTPLPHDESEPKKRRRKRKSDSLTGAILNHLTKPQQPLPASTSPDELAQKIPSPPLSEVSPRPDDQGNDELNAPSAHAPSTSVAVQPKKMLKLNPRTGTFGSPRKPKFPTRPSRIVCIKYGEDDEKARQRIGDEISQILQGRQQRSLDAVDQPIDTTAKSLAKAKIAKTTHPFFSKTKVENDKPAESAQKPSAERHTVFRSTPCSPRKPKNVFTTEKAVHFNIRSSGTKVPGAMHPLWPAQGMSHVRGGDYVYTHAKSDGPSRGRKSKGLVTSIPAHESLMGRVTQDLNLASVRSCLSKDPDRFDPAPAELRLPQRHFESGRKLRNRVRSQVQTRFIDTTLYEDCDFGPDELLGPRASRAHAALEWLYKSLDHQLSAYDRSSCENLAWTQKYAPTTSAQILQRGQEALFLSDWLQTLRVQSVESGSSNEKDKEKEKGEGGVKKKRKKNKADDFIMESDEDSDTLYEISDDDGDWHPDMGRARKSAMRSVGSGKGGRDQGRLVNAVLLSGPHGCGKTAAVYAVAKEHDFEVFEINSSSRRSGKDILEKVGDMTRNHLVQHKHDRGDAEGDEVVDKDIKTGKQGMMTTFFKPKDAASSKKGRKQQQQQQQQQQTSEGGEKEKAAPKAQKQSLILVEEVDVLFEEDKQFWATLMGLMAQSKRPFIMTCNDESLVPVQSLRLHGIFRFRPAPRDLAVDACLLIAAREGHALHRSAVEALYRSRGDDLRATLTELNYWCQIGVGDRRGGFDWFYPRWPRGRDVDEEGHVVRVISEDTYQKGMGWVARDEMATMGDALKAEEEAMRQSWEHWQRDVGDWCKTADVARESRELADYERFCETMSDADVCSSGGYATGLQEVLDATALDGAKMREEYVVGATLLDAQPSHGSPMSSSMAISTYLRSRARLNLRLPAINEEAATQILDAGFGGTEWHMTRWDIAVAFDSIAVASRGAPTTHLDASVFDGPMTGIVEDVAPWVRGIVAHEQRLAQRRRVGIGGKRMRSTRSALSALEGGERGAMRERHFGDCLNAGWVMRTGGRWVEWES